MSIFLMLLAPIWEWSKLTFFKPKIIKSSYFEFQKSNIPQRKLKTHEIRIQLEKIRINTKNFKKINFFQFSWHARGPQKISVFRFQKILKNVFQKLLYWDKSNSGRNKATNFGDPSPTHVETTGKCMVPGSYWPMPAWNRAKILSDYSLIKRILAKSDRTSSSSDRELILGRWFERRRLYQWVMAIGWWECFGMAYIDISKHNTHNIGGQRPARVAFGYLGALNSYYCETPGRRN